MREPPKAALFFPPRRTVVCADASLWMHANLPEPGTSVVTSLPDLSELPHLGFNGWREWFTDAARDVMRWVPQGGASIFFQSDMRHDHAWVDKSYFIMHAAQDVGARLVWHKIVCRRPAGTISLGRSTFSHMLCFTRGDLHPPVRPGPDVIADAGYMPWPRAMGENACRVALRYLRDETPTRTIVDPFCGEGSILAVANQLGFDAVGIDLSIRRCRAAAEQNLVQR